MGSWSGRRHSLVIFLPHEPAQVLIGRFQQPGRGILECLATGKKHLLDFISRLANQLPNVFRG